MSVTAVQAAELYLRYDYPEWKDLAKSFITLASAILVVSISFSEKIIDFPRAGKFERRVMFGSWATLVLSIILCGLSICALAWSAGYAAQQTLSPYHWVYSLGHTYHWFAFIATLLLVAAGSTFTLSLTLLAWAAFLTVRRGGQAAPG